MASLSALLHPARDADEYEYAKLPSMLEEREEDDAFDGPRSPRASTGASDAARFLLDERGERGARDGVPRIKNLDAWFASLYAYFNEKGFACIITSRVVNLLTLGFTIFFSGFLLLYVDWEYLGGECAAASLDYHSADAPGAADGGSGGCDVLRDAVFASPLKHRSALSSVVIVAYLALASLYWFWCFARLALDARGLLEMRAFCTRKLQLSDRDVQTATWPEVVARVVHLQATTRLCIVKDLNEHDIVARILRRENYFLGMLNRGVLGLTLDVPGLRRKTWLTKAVEWNITHAVFAHMFDDDFRIRSDFYDVGALKTRMRVLALVNLCLSPFIATFMMMYFCLHHVERFYHDPGSAGHRQWSTHARWRLREFNELEHFTDQRLRLAHKPASKYVAQFPSPAVSVVAKFVSYVVGACMAFTLACTLLIDDRLLHAEVFGRDLLWHTAVMGAVLAASRGMIGEENRAFEPNRWMREVVKHTHYLPKRWRDQAHRKDVQAEFEGMFQFKAGLFLQEVLSIFAVPFVLWFPMCDAAPDIVRFVKEFTTRAPGVGDVCSLSAFDFARHGNAKYGAPAEAAKAARSKQGKMEKSFLSFHANYPTWEPDASGREMIDQLEGFAEREEAASAVFAREEGGDSRAALGNGGSRAAPFASSLSAREKGARRAFAAPGSASMFSRSSDASGLLGPARVSASASFTASEASGGHAGFSAKLFGPGAGRFGAASERGGSGGDDDADADGRRHALLQMFYETNIRGGDDVKRRKEDRRGRDVNGSAKGSDAAPDPSPPVPRVAPARRVPASFPLGVERAKKGWNGAAMETEMTAPSPGTSASPPAPSPPAPFPPRRPTDPAPPTNPAPTPGVASSRESRESRSLWDDPPPNLWDEEREHPTG